MKFLWSHCRALFSILSLSIQSHYNCCCCCCCCCYPSPLHAVCVWWRKLASKTMNAACRPRSSKPLSEKPLKILWRKQRFLSGGGGKRSSLAQHAPSRDRYLERAWKNHQSNNKISMHHACTHFQSVVTCAFPAAYALWGSVNRCGYHRDSYMIAISRYAYLFVRMYSLVHRYL